MTPWKKLDNKSLVKLRNHYLEFEPYAHLNIVDIWGYKVGPVYWHETGDTIVYRLHDYIDDQKYFTILGRSDAKKAIVELSMRYKDLDKITIDCVPQTTLDALGSWNAIVSKKEDIDNFDYIFDVDELINFNTTELRHKYRAFKKLTNKYPDLTTRLLDLNNPYERQRIYNLFRLWVKTRHAVNWQKEFRALKRTLNLRQSEIVCLGVFDKKKMVGFTVNEPEPTGFYQGHFGKADYSYSSIGVFLEYETAKYMKAKFGSKFLNLQQDLGIEGIRHYKVSLGPCGQLKKYTVVIDAKKARASIK